MNNVENKQKPIRGLDAPTKLARRQGEKSQSNIYRTLFMQDRDRVLYSAPFRLLAGKTQVYITGIDDNMRTRLTHTLEVAQIAKTISASLKLDVELTEAIALAHDIGHTPYGHAGERELHEILNPRAKHAIENCSLDIKASDEEYMINDYSSELGFKHNLHGVEVAIREAEITKGQSLSLTNYTLYGIGHHSSCKYKADGIQAEKKVGYYNKYDKYCLAGSNPAWSFEAFVVAQADEIAQRHHDLEDAVRGQLLSHEYVYNQIDRCFSRYFMSRDKQTMKMLKIAKENKDDAVFYAELSRLIVWGIENEGHRIIGTGFEYRKAKKGNMELELWLAQQVNPKIGFTFHEVPLQDECGNKIHVTLIEIPCAEGEPTRYGSVSYIRIGSNLKHLSEFKEKEAELWRKFDKTPLEKRIAYTEAGEEDVVTLLDYPGYYRKLGLPIPGNRDKVLQDLSDEKFIYKNDGGTWDITNYGALMIAADLRKFERLSKHVVRVIRYPDKSRLGGIGEREFSSGYVISFEEIVAYIMTVIPQEEIMERGIRKQRFSFPESAIRELLANTLVHQALDQYGTNPMIEIFADRIEFSNAGAPLVAIERIIDTVPLSRNENMAGFMYRCGICEERGSGYDKIIAATSADALLAPKIENQNNQFTKVTLFSKIPFELTAKEDRVRTCYMFACLAFVNSSAISNADIRSAFGLEENDKVKASRVIRDTMNAKLIKPVDPSTAPRYMRYVPFWA